MSEKMAFTTCELCGGGETPIKDWAESELEEMRSRHNPQNEPTGHFTGRCARCHSKNLWDDFTAYGCNCCGAIFAVGDVNPRLVCNHCGTQFEMEEGHNCSS